MGVNVLGPVDVDGGSSLEPRDRAVVAVLTVRRGQVVSPVQIADAVWGDSPPGSWPKQVQICIGRIRRALGTAAIETTGGGYRLTLGDDEIDARRFEQLVERGRVLSVSGEPDRAAATLGRALALWRGSPLEYLDGWAPARSEAARLEELRRSAEEDWLDARLAAGDHRAVAAEAEALVNAEPLRERRWMSLALAQYRCARQGDALRSLARARHALVEQLGVSPGAELVELEAAILRQDPFLAAVGERAAADADCPFKGLASFDESDAECFFGRDVETAACVERLVAHPFLVVAGASGCGKSSLLRAGVVPGLKRCGHDVVVLVPGYDPHVMTAEIGATTDGTVLIVDQFEELFALGHQQDAVDEVCRALVRRVVDGGSVVVAIRSDRLGALSVDPELARLVERGLHLVAPLTGAALRQAIEEPARLAGLRLEHGLVELLVRDCDGEPGGLPLLSHALVETWRRRDGATLTVDGYRASGGIRGAVARSADRLYDGLAVEERLTLRGILLRLVTPSLEGDPVRCRVPSRNLLGDPARERIIGMLVRARLITSEADSFEVAHEALTRAWPRLRSWLDDDVAGQRILRHLAVAADGWDSLGRPHTELYRGARLATALEWRDGTTQQLTELERAFLDASEEHARSERHALEARAVHDAVTNRRLRRLLALSAVMLVGALTAGLVAVVQADRANDEREVSALRELTATATADVDVDPERSALLALAALDRAGTDGGAVRREIEQALHDAVTQLRVEHRLVDAGRTVDWSADGRNVLTTGRRTGDVEVRDLTGRTVRSFTTDASDVIDSPDGRLLAVAGRDGTVRVLETTTGDQRAEIHGDGGPTDLVFSPDGRFVAAAWPGHRGGAVRIVDLSTGTPVRDIAWPGANKLAFSPEESRLAVISSSSGAVFDLAEGRQSVALDPELGAFTDVEWSPDGRWIAIAKDAGAAQVHEADSGRRMIVVAGHRSSVGAVAWSPDSTLLATASSDGTTIVWSLIEGGGRNLMTLTADDTRSGFQDVVFSPDGSRVATSTNGGTALVWRVDLDAGAEVATLPAAAAKYGTAVFTADGRQLLATGGSGSVAVWDVASWQRTRTLGTEVDDSTPTRFGIPLGVSSDPIGLAPSPDGRLVAAVSDDQFFGVVPVVTVHDVEGGGLGFQLDVGGWVSNVGWSPNGQLFVVAGGDRNGDATVTITDRTGRVVSTRRLPGRFVQTAQFTLDEYHLVVAHSSAGTYVPGDGRVEVWDRRSGDVVASLDADAWYAYPLPNRALIAIGPRDEAADQTVTIWDYRYDERVATLAGHTGAVNGLMFDADGTRMATASNDGSIRIWDVGSGHAELVLNGHAGLVANVSFSPDGRWLASTGAEGTVRVWALDLDELADIARQRVTRSLTDAECQRYLRQPDCAST